MSGVYIVVEGLKPRPNGNDGNDRTNSDELKSVHAVYLIPATPFKGLVLFYLLTVIYDVTVTIKIYLVT